MLSRLRKDLKTAMKASDKVRVTALRNVIAKVRAREIDTGKELSEQDIIKVLSGYEKQLRDSIFQYESANRQDLVDKEAQELTVIQEYLPVPLTDEEVKAVVQKVIATTGATSMADMGKVMPAVMQEISGKGDGKLAQAYVKELLAG